MPFHVLNLDMPRRQIVLQQQISGAIFFSGTATPTPAQTEAEYGQALGLYLEREALRERLLRTTEPRLGGRNVGVELDDRIREAFEAGRMSTDQRTLQTTKAMISWTLDRFFWTAVFEELNAGTQEGWDRAFAYFGVSEDGGLHDGISFKAQERDLDSGTSYADNIFTSLVEGSCVLAKALRETGALQIDPNDYVELKAILDRVDGHLRRINASVAGHELLSIPISLTVGRRSCNPWCRLTQFEAMFRGIELLMLTGSSASRARADRIRATIDPLYDDVVGAWFTTFDSAPVVRDLEDEYSIDIQ